MNCTELAIIQLNGHSYVSQCLRTTKLRTVQLSVQIKWLQQLNEHIKRNYIRIWYNDKHQSMSMNVTALFHQVNLISWKNLHDGKNSIQTTIIIIKKDNINFVRWKSSVRNCTQPQSISWQLCWYFSLLPKFCVCVLVWVDLPKMAKKGSYGIQSI